MEIGFIGLGSMGFPMAENLLKAGHSLLVWNRSQEKAQALARLGAKVVERPADAVKPDGIVVTMVADDAALEAIVNGPDGIASKLAAGGIHLSMSTVSPALAERLNALHRSRGSAYIAAPVFGRPDAAAAKLLFMLCAGPAQACRAVQPVIEAMAEAMTLGEKHGVPREKMIEVLSQSIFPAPLFVNYGKQIATHTYEPARFKLPLGLKDANLVLAAANSVHVPMPLASLMLGRFLTAMAKARGDLDWTAAALNVSEDAGLQPGRSNKTNQA